MTREDFERLMQEHAAELEAIRLAAHALHESVNQHYDGDKPYGVHLDMVAQGVRLYGHGACAAEEDVVPMLFGAYFHDSIEDARLTYNDVKRTARQWMSEQQATMAAELVYALTNEKGRTREERAGERYYEGIRSTPYAPLVKWADRRANMTYSLTHGDGANEHMREVYARELPHFLEAINAHSEDPRMSFPSSHV